MNVPKSHIISLRDEQATRAKIIDGFAALRDIAAGQPRDVALIIYYAGHGARIEKPVEWEDWSASEDQIEMLCPHDIGVPATDKDGVEGVIQGIPDRTISVLLNHLSDIRGDNIVCDPLFSTPFGLLSCPSQRPSFSIAAAQRGSTAARPITSPVRS